MPSLTTAGFTDDQQKRLLLLGLTQILTFEVLIITAADDIFFIFQRKI